MPHQSFNTRTVVTQRTRGVRFSQAGDGAPELAVLITMMRLNDEIMATAMDISWGLENDISNDAVAELYLSVVNLEALPEEAAMISDNAWSDAQRWQTAVGSFTIPTQTYFRSDPRWFRPKAWRADDVGASTRRRGLALVSVSDSNTWGGFATVHWTSIEQQRSWPDDNAYADLQNRSDFADDYGMEFDD